MDPTATTKETRLNIRSTRAEKDLVERAAEALHMPMSQFVMQAALRSAEDVLADQTRIVLPKEKWDEFVAKLDRPARVVPALREAASKPSPFSER